MTAASWHTRSIYAAEEYVRALFDTITPADNGGCDKMVSLQKEFKPLVRLAQRRFESLKDDLGRWQRQVRSGDVDFAPEQEGDFKEALRAFVALSGLLVEKFDLFHKKSNLYLIKPRDISLVDAHKKEASNILDSWESPEWEVANMRTVKWNEEQTRYLRKRLGAGK